MSAEGCSPDNAACEGFFGRLKNEFFHHRDWRGVTLGEFEEGLGEHLEYYCEGRLKKSLGWMSPQRVPQKSWIRRVGGPRNSPRPQAVSLAQMTQADRALT